MKVKSVHIAESFGSVPGRRIVVRERELYFCPARFDIIRRRQWKVMTKNLR